MADVRNTFLSTSELMARYGVDRRTIRRWKSAGRLPAPVRISPRSPRYRLSELMVCEARSKSTRRRRRKPAAEQAKPAGT